MGSALNGVLINLWYVELTDAHVGHVQDFQEADIFEQGLWQHDNGAGSVWRMTLHTSGAQSHILVFR